MSEEEFIHIVSARSDDDHDCNNLSEEFIKEIAVHIGDVEPSPFRISDIVKYRGGSDDRQKDIQQEIYEALST